MSNGRGSAAVTRAHVGDRFSNPPLFWRYPQFFLHHKQSQRQNQKLLKSVKSEAAVAEKENWINLDKSKTTLSEPPPDILFSSAGQLNDATNLDRLLESVTPSAPAQCCSKDEESWFYFLGDLWESFKEWSVYGVGVPLLLNGKDSVMQYYVPFLSGIQLYVEPLEYPSGLRRPTVENDSKLSRRTSSGYNSDCEANLGTKCVMSSLWNEHSLMGWKSPQIDRLSLRDKILMNSSLEEAEMHSSPGRLLFEYLEQEQPHNRKPLADKISALTSQSPDLRMLRSCDLMPDSWISVAWYPIYRIPTGPTLRDLDVSFLTFHSLSTHPISNGQSKGTDASSSKVSLPVFGLASYKLDGSILTLSGSHECCQEKTLFQAANDWLCRLQVDLPDFKFFRSRN
ncbi:hypothetical protein NMG60_11035063 [Bertholletia excelsa]